MKSLFLTAILHSISFTTAKAECTYRIENDSLERHFSQDIRTYLENEKGYVYQPNSSNLLNMKSRKTKVAFPYLNATALVDTIFLGMLEMKQDFQLSISDDQKKAVVTGNGTYRFFGDEHSRAMHLHQKSMKRALIKAVDQFESCHP